MKPEFLTVLLRVEGRRVDVVREQHVIIEVQEVLTEAGDAVQVGFDRNRVERRQMFWPLENLLVRHYSHSGVACIQPVGNLSICHYVHIAYPWRKLVQRPQ